MKRATLDGSGCSLAIIPGPACAPVIRGSLASTAERDIFARMALAFVPCLLTRSPVARTALRWQR